MYPNQFRTSVKTPCRALWENNPYVSAAKVCSNLEIIPLDYVQRAYASDNLPGHFVGAFHEALSKELGISLTPQMFHGDIHLSEEEKTRPDYCPEKYWIVNAGGKPDIPVKIWPDKNFQEIIKAFPDTNFIQTGASGHIHPRFANSENLINMVGQTDIRGLIRLILHAEGVLTGVSLPMHLSAALKRLNGSVRPCVVIGGGREPAHWEAYPGHSYMHIRNTLRCTTGWCRHRVSCPEAEKGLPARCMSMITPEEVIAQMRKRMEYV